MKIITALCGIMLMLMSVSNVFSEENGEKLKYESSISPATILKWNLISQVESKNNLYVSVYYNSTNSDKNFKMAIVYNLKVCESPNNCVFKALAFELYNEQNKSIESYEYNPLTYVYEKTDKLDEEILILNVLKRIKEKELKDRQKEINKPTIKKGKTLV